MANVIADLVIWWQGKKTILGGSLVIAAAVAGVWFGKLDPVTAVGVAGVGFSICGASAKANRHQVELLEALQGVADMGATYRSSQPSSALHISASTAAGVIDTLQRLQAGVPPVPPGNSPVDKIAASVDRVTANQIPHVTSVDV